jgi:hypothetical protein
MEMAMGRLLCLIFVVLVLLASSCARGPKPLPSPPAGLTWQPGRYVQASYFAPDFKPDEVSYTLAVFPVEKADRAPAAAFQNTFQEELVRAWQAQGLKVGPGERAVTLSGTIHHLSLRGVRVRWLTGRVHASLTISGTVTRGEQVLFAFRDQVNLSSPLAPGPTAPREQEMLLGRLAREAVHHILNELLLQGRTPDSG